MSRVDETTDIEAWFAAAPDKWIECRDSGHAMRRMHGDYVEEVDSQRRRVHTVTRRCNRCGTRRKNAYSPGDYRWLWSNYIYPDGYQTHGAGLTRQNIRQLIGGSYEPAHDGRPRLRAVP